MTRINLLPQQWADKQERNRATRMAIAILVAWTPVLLVILGLWYVRGHNVHSAIDQSKSEIDDLMTQTSKMSVLAQQKQRILKELEDQASMLLPLKATYTMALMTSCMPEGVGLTDMVIDAPMPDMVDPAMTRGREAVEVKPHLARPPAIQLQLQGYATDDLAVAQYVEKLGRRPLFQNVKLGMSREIAIDEHRLHQFFLTMAAPMDRTFVTEDQP